MPFLPAPHHSSGLERRKQGFAEAVEVCECRTCGWYRSHRDGMGQRAAQAARGRGARRPCRMAELAGGMGRGAADDGGRAVED